MINVLHFSSNFQVTFKLLKRAFKILIGSCQARCKYLKVLSRFSDTGKFINYSLLFCNPIWPLLFSLDVYDENDFEYLHE